MEVHLVPLITILALIQYFRMGIAVGAARGKFNIKAPATTGNPDFERILRVQMNTLEALPMFLGSMWLFAMYINPLLAGLLGIVWIIGREMYAIGYTKAAEQRSAGFGVQAIATIIMTLGALAGIIAAMAGSSLAFTL